MRLPAPLARWPLAIRLAAGIALAALLLILALAIVPLGWLRGPAERALTHRLGRDVRIGAVDRIDAFALAPRIALRDLRIAQPAWVGRGEMATSRGATLRLPLLPLLWGSARPRDLALDGLRVALVHDAAGRTNWTAQSSGGNRAPLGTLRLTDARITLADARRHLELTAIAAADAAGLRIDATGTHRGTPARLIVRGGPIAGDVHWPFRATFASPIAQLALDGVADTPLAIGHVSGAARAAAADLGLVGDLIGTGLPHTQPVAFTARLRRDSSVWTLTAVQGHVGRSDVTGHLVIAKRGGRTRLDGRLVSYRFSFDDLADDRKRANGAAKRAAIGKRLIPDTRIDLAKLANLDGRLEVAAHRLRASGRSAVRAFSATLTLDRTRLVVQPLTAALAHGAIEGRAVVDQRSGAPPLLDLDLRVVGGRLEDFIAKGVAHGPLRATIRLVGRGGTTRTALAGADGSVAIASRGGVVSRLVAETLGRNAGAAFVALLGVGADQTPLRCLGARFRAVGGTLRPEMLTLDTGVMRADGRGTIRLDGERVALTLDGRSKHPGLATLPTPIEITGTLTTPVIETGDAGVASAKTLVRTLGSAIRGLLGGRPEVPAAADIDCGALMARVG